MSSKTQNSKKCAGCSKDLLTSELLKCTTCSLKYHFECLNISNKKFKDISQEYKTTWVCPSCRSKQPKGDNSNTPVRGSCSNSDSSPTTNVTFRRPLSNMTSDTPGHISLETVKDLIQESMDRLVTKMEEKIEKLMEIKTRDIFKEFSDIKDSFKYLDTQYSDLKKELQLKCSQMKVLSEENVTLKSNIKDLSNRLNIMEQHSRMSNIEIQCIPEYKSENLVNVVTQIANVTGNKLKEEDIHKCTRIAKLNPENKRPRSVIVKFSNPRVRDNFMASVIQFNKKHRDDKLNTSHIGIGGEKKPIYIADHLPPETKKIHALARETAKRLHYKFVWTKNGRVFMRKTETSEHIMIREQSQLESLT